MFGLVSKKQYNILVEQNDMLIRENIRYKDIHINSGFWYIQKEKDHFVCSKCKSETSFTLDNILAKCPICNTEMIGLKNDPFKRITNETAEINKLKLENKKLKNKISSMQMDIEGLEENKKFYEGKYREVSNVMREIQNRLFDENNQIPDKCSDCNSDLFYDPIGHYGMCLKCGKNYNMNRMLKVLRENTPEIIRVIDKNIENIKKEK